jgi:hypothetical protein
MERIDQVTCYECRFTELKQDIVELRRAMNGTADMLQIHRHRCEAEISGPVAVVPGESKP